MQIAEELRDKVLFFPACADLVEKFLPVEIIAELFGEKIVTRSNDI